MGTGNAYQKKKKKKKKCSVTLLTQFHFVLLDHVHSVSFHGTDEAFLTRMPSLGSWIRVETNSLAPAFTLPC
jgi:hypothetical protein